MTAPYAPQRPDPNVYRPSPGPKTAGKGMRTTGRWLTWIGVGLLVALGGGGIYAAFAGIGSSIPDDASITVIDGDTIVTVAPGETIYLYNATSGAASFSAQQCTVIDDTGDEYIPSFSFTQSSSFTKDAKTYGSFTPLLGDDSATFTVNCSTADVIAAPAVDMASIAVGIGGIFLALFGGGLAAILLIVGIVLWVMGAKRLRAASGA